MGYKEYTCTYCDGSRLGLMIYCERCLTWYHYRCVNKKWDLPLTRKDLDYLCNYYCYPCRRANPELKLKYFSSGNYRRPLDDSNKVIEKDDEGEKEPQKLMINQASHGKTPFGTKKMSPKSPSETSSNSSQLSSDSFSSSTSSSTKFDEAVENKLPDKSTRKHNSSSCTIESSHTASSKQDDQNYHQHQGHNHDQQEQDNQGQPETFKHGTDDKKSRSTTKQFRSRPSKGNRAKLRSKLDAIRRQKHSSKVYIKPKLL